MHPSDHWFLMQGLGYTLDILFGEKAPPSFDHMGAVFSAFVQIHELFPYLINHAALAGMVWPCRCFSCQNIRLPRVSTAWA